MTWQTLINGSWIHRRTWQWGTVQCQSQGPGQSTQKYPTVAYWSLLIKLLDKKGYRKVPLTLPVSLNAGNKSTHLSLALRNPEPKTLHIPCYSFTNLPPKPKLCLDASLMSTPTWSAFLLSVLHKLTVSLSKKYKKLAGSSFLRVSSMISHVHILNGFSPINGALCQFYYFPILLLV